MFSWSKKKDNRRRGRPERDSEENEFGIKMDKGPDDKQLEAELKRLAGVDSLPEDDLNLNEGEEDEEAELLRLIGGGGHRKPVKKETNPVESVGDLSDLTAEVDLGDEDVEVDENDPDLLGELLELTNPDPEIEEQEPESDSEPEDKPSSTGATDILTTLKERLKLYRTAEAKAKENNETSRARRFSRGIKTLEDLIKKAKAGKAVSPSDIPPVIALNLKPAPPPSEVPANENMNGDLGEAGEETESLQQQFSSTENGESNEPPQESEDVLKTLEDRLKLYQTAEKKAKEGGESTRARRFNRGIKTLEGLIKDAKAGKQVAPADIPPVIALNLKPAPPAPVQPPLEENLEGGSEESLENEMGNISLASVSDDAESKGSQEQERNILDVLSERLQMYRAAEAKAQESGETSRARRFNRGVKTLQDLIRQATAGKPIPPDDIPPVVALNLKPGPPIQVSEEENPREAATERENLVRSSDLPSKPLSFAAVDDVDVEEELELEEEIPTTVLEGLQQRARFYSRFQQDAKQEGNSALADHIGRIVGVYLNAIKTFKSGGYVDVENLPNPKGCPPIPIPFYAP